MPGIRSLISTVRSSLAVLRLPPYVRPGHFYSPLTNPEDVARAARWRPAGVAPAVDLRADAQLGLLQELSPLWRDVPRVTTPGWRYSPENGMFGFVDAAVYHAVLRHVQPRRVIEIGSGFSSAIALDTADRHLPNTQFTFIEPNPERLLGLLHDDDDASTRLHRTMVQDVPVSLYDDLGAGDILFIDSTHVVKAGSDVVWLVLNVLPRLAPGVLVHVHDVFWPFEYPVPWLVERRDWTENYLLHAFLAYNSAFEIVFFPSWLWHVHQDATRSALSVTGEHEPGSIWLRRRELA